MEREFRGNKFLNVLSGSNIVSIHSSREEDSVCSSSNSSDDEVDFKRRKFSDIEPIDNMENAATDSENSQSSSESFISESADSIILNFQRFLDNIKSFFNQNLFVYDLALKYLLEFVTIYITNLQSKDSEKSFQSKISLESSVLNLFNGNLSLFEDFATNIRPIRKLLELRSFIIYEVYAMSKIEAKSPEEEMTASLRGLTIYLSQVREALPPLEFFSWLVSLEQVHNCSTNLAVELNYKIQLLNGSNSFLHDFSPFVKNVIYELYPFPVPLSLGSGLSSFSSIDTKSELSDEVFRKMVKEFVDKLLVTFTRAHFLIFRYLFEILHPFFTEQVGDLNSVISSLRVLFEQTPIPLNYCLNFIRKQFLFKFYAYIANVIHNTVRSGAVSKLMIDDAVLCEQRNTYFAQVVDDVKSTRMNERLLIGMQNLLHFYSLHRLGRGIDMMTILQRMNEVIVHSKDEKIIPRLFTMFPLEASAASRILSLAPKIGPVPPVVQWRPPHRAFAQHHELIQKMLAESSQSMQAAAHLTSSASSASSSRSLPSLSFKANNRLSYPMNCIIDLTDNNSNLSAVSEAIIKTVSPTLTAMKPPFQPPVATSSKGKGKGKSIVNVIPIDPMPLLPPSVHSLQATAAAAASTTAAVSNTASTTTNSKHFINPNSNLAAIRSDPDDVDSALSVLCNLASLKASELEASQKFKQFEKTSRITPTQSESEILDRKRSISSCNTFNKRLRHRMDGEKYNISSAALLTAKLECNYNQLVNNERLDMFSTNLSYLDASFRPAAVFPVVKHVPKD